MLLLLFCSYMNQTLSNQKKSYFSLEKNESRNNHAIFQCLFPYLIMYWNWCDVAQFVDFQFSNEFND